MTTRIHPLVAKSELKTVFLLSTASASSIPSPTLHKLPPPVQDERSSRDLKTYWQNLSGHASLLAPQGACACFRDLEIDYTALGPFAPEKIRFPL